MSKIKLSLLRATIKRLSSRILEFEKTRNLGGILRIIAIKTVASGASFEDTAELVRVTPETVRNWVNDFIFNGEASLEPAPPTGRRKTLSDSEVKTLQRVLEKPPTAYGLRGGCWNANKVKKVIQEQFGKTLSTKYIPEFLKSIGLTFKKARVDAGEKNEVKRERWIEYTWPKIVDTAEKQGGHIFFGDEAYFSIFGTSAYTWSLCGVETVIPSTGSKENIHIIGAINFSTGKTHALMLEEGRINEEVYIAFLATLLKETRKPIHLIIDNAGYHKSKKVREFITANSKRLTVHYLPPYSPDYNPIEGLWKKLKQETTHNLYFETIDSLWEALAKGLRWFREAPAEIIALCGFYHNLA
jgi:transposase